MQFPSRSRNKIPLVTIAIFAASLGPLRAEGVCMVSDPTGSHLNIRMAPNGKIIADLTNGTHVSIVDSTIDERGRSWVFVRLLTADIDLGWVYQRFIKCNALK